MAILTERKAQSISPGGEKLPDGIVKGLWLAPAKAKGRGYWSLRYTSPTRKRRRDIQFGTYPEVPIVVARERAREAREQIAQGLDPLEIREAEKLQAQQPPSVMTFEAAAMEFIRQKKDGWSNAKHAAQWPSTFKTYVFPFIGDRPVDSLTVNDFRAVLEPIWLTKLETADRIKQRCEKVMQWCEAQGLVPSNVVRLVTMVLPERLRGQTATHYPAMPWRDIPDFVASVLRDGTLGSCRALIEMLILTATRSGEARRMTWDQVDLEARIWTIPAGGTKMRREHQVPLSDRCIEILQEQRVWHQRLHGCDPAHTDLVFPSPGGKVFSDMTLSKFLKDHQVPSDTKGRYAVPHGFRTSFRGWATVRQVYEPIIEQCLAHVESNKTIAAYKRELLLEDRRKVMEEYAQFCGESKNFPGLLRVN